MSEKILQQLSQLRNYHKPHLELGKYMLEAYKGALYPLDLLAVAAMNRSLNLLDGFCMLIESKNFIAAAPLIRLQVDNALRFSAAFLVQEPHKFAIEVLKGKPIRKLRSRDNQQMTDRYLVEKMTEDFPWIGNVYEHTSGYIHLSEKHIFNAFYVNEKERDQGKFSAKISLNDQFVPDNIYLEAIDAFKAVTDIFLKYIHEWAYTKDNPEVVEKLKEQTQSNRA